jgi:pimeloyl-ACP methyl ester carboxylesterase
LANATTTIQTSGGAVSLVQSPGAGLPLVLLHGNSMSRDVFARQLNTPIAGHYRMIAMDLPGHGLSDDAADPFTGYTLPGYAAVVREVLEALDVRTAAFLGWSLGGHVALELASTWTGVAGIVLCGAPPATASPESLGAAFLPNPVFPLLGCQVLGKDDAAAMAEAFFGAPAPDFALRDILRTDGRARRLLFESLFAGNAADERALVETSSLPIAIVEGAAEPFASPDYLDQVAFRNLWENQVHRIPNAAHVPFLENADAFNQVLLRFMRDMTRLLGPGSIAGEFGVQRGPRRLARVGT